MLYKTKKKNFVPTQLDGTYNIQEGETLERRLARINESEEPINDINTPLIFQERKAGVDPFCDIRTDRMQLAQDARDKISRTHLLARANRDDMGKKPIEEFTYVTDSNGNIIKNEPVKKD